MRPKEGCPSAEYLLKKSNQELTGMLVTALKNQMKELKDSSHPFPHILSELKKELIKAEKQYSNFIKK